MVPVLGLLFWFYANALDTRDASVERIRHTQLARVVIDRMAKEIRQATGFSGGFGTGIFGTRERISINTVVIPDKALVERRGARAERRPGQFDLRQIDYYIAWDDVNLDEDNDPRALGLIRRERKTFNRLGVTEAEALAGEADAASSDNANDNANDNGSGIGQDDAGGLLGGDAANDDGAPRPQFGQSSNDVFDDNLGEELADEEMEGAKRELYAPELKFIEFFYHDGTRWWDSWEISEGNSLPQMVMITVGYEPELPENEDIEIIDDILKSEGDIDPLPRDRYMVIVRVPQADSLFLGPRLQREVSSLAGLEDVE